MFKHGEVLLINQDKSANKALKKTKIANEQHVK